VSWRGRPCLGVPSTPGAMATLAWLWTTAPSLNQPPEPSHPTLSPITRLQPHPPQSRSIPMRISQIMTRHVVTVGLDDTVQTVRDLFDKFRFHHVLVVENTRVVGVVSDRDLLRHISPFAGKLSETPRDAASLNKRIHQVMTRQLVSASEDMPVEEAGLLMLHHKVSCLPVLSPDGRCRGIVTLSDLLRWCLQGRCTPTQRAA
jgi:acetoin utilization protein AcuB